MHIFFRYILAGQFVFWCFVAKFCLLSHNNDPHQFRISVKYDFKKRLLKKIKDWCIWIFRGSFCNFWLWDIYTFIVDNIQCLQYIFYSLLSIQKRRVCVKWHKNNPQTSRIQPRQDMPPPNVLKFLDPPLVVLYQNEVLFIKFFLQCIYRYICMEIYIWTFILMRCNCDYSVRPGRSGIDWPEPYFNK